MHKILTFIFVIICSPSTASEFFWEKDIKINSVYACAGRADPQAKFGNNGVMPTFLKFEALLKWYMPFYNGPRPNFLFYTDTDADDAHIFWTRDGTMEMKIKAYPVKQEKTTILKVSITPTNPIRASEIGAPLIQYCTNIPDKIFENNY